MRDVLNRRRPLTRGFDPMEPLVRATPSPEFGGYPMDVSHFNSPAMIQPEPAPFGGMMSDEQRAQQRDLALRRAANMVRAAETRKQSENVEGVIGKVSQLRQAMEANARMQAAREKLRMDTAKSRAMTGTYQNPELTRLGNAEQIAAAMERARGGAAPGQQIDPRWMLGGISVSGQGLTRGGGAAPMTGGGGRVPMDAEALRERLSEMAGHKPGPMMTGKYSRSGYEPVGYRVITGAEDADGMVPEYRVIAGKPELVRNGVGGAIVNTNGGGVALVGNLTPERRAQIAEQRAEALGKAGTKTLLEAARDKRREKNVTRMLSSRNPAVRERGMALMEAMRGPQQAGSGVDMAGIMAQAQRISNQYGPMAGRMALDSMLAGATAAADRAARTAELDKTLASQEKVARERAEADLKLATDPRVVLMQGLQAGLTPEQAMERVRAVQAMSGGGAGVAAPSRPIGPVVPRPFEAAGGPPIPVAPPVVMPPIRPGGRVIDEEYKRGSYTGSLGDAWNPYARR